MFCARRYKEMITLVQSGSGLFNISDFVPALSRFDLQGVQAKLRKIPLRFDDMITSLLDEHSATAKQRQGRPDFIDKLRASMADSKDSNDADTISEVNVKGFVFVSGNFLIFSVPFICPGLLCCTSE